MLYAKEEYDFDENLVYRPPSFHDVWLYEKGRHDRNCELDHKRWRQENRLHKWDCEIHIPDITPLNRKDKNLPPVGSHDHDDESDSDSSVGPPLSKSEVELDAGNGSPELFDTPATNNTQDSAQQESQSRPESYRDNWKNKLSQPTT